MNPDLTRTYPWILAAANARVGASVVDGDMPPFQAKTLLVETKKGGNPPTGPFDVAGAVVLQFEGQGPPAWYVRRFALGGWGSVSLQVEQFRSFRLFVVANTLAAFDIVAMASSGDEASSQPLLVYPETLPAGGGVVPWGASEMVPAQADVGFNWESNGILIPVAMVAGVSQPIAGVRYIPGVFPFSAVWRIRP